MVDHRRCSHIASGCAHCRSGHEAALVLRGCTDRGASLPAAATDERIAPVPSKPGAHRGPSTRLTRGAGHRNQSARAGPRHAGVPAMFEATVEVPDLQIGRMSMLLSVTTTHAPATDLGYLLGKHPE